MNDFNPFSYSQYEPTEVLLLCETFLNGLNCMLIVLLMICRLDGVKLENGKINVVNKKNGNKPKLNQKKW